MKKSRKKSTSTSAAASTAAASAEATPEAEDKQPSNKAFTPPKGRPTPKRNEQERQAGVRRGPYQGPETPAEARKRRKELKASMSKEEYKELKAKERREREAERRHINERMMAGDERYLMDRDKGPERRFVRDWVDSHRYLGNFFMPIALVVVLIMVIGLRNPMLANTASLVMFGILILMVIEGIILGRKVNRLVREKYPDTTLGKFGLGMYAFGRATMIRKMRNPAPQVEIGEDVR